MGFLTLVVREVISLLWIVTLAALADAFKLSKVLDLHVGDRHSSFLSAQLGVPENE